VVRDFTAVIIRRSARHPTVLQNEIGEHLFDFKQNKNQDDQPKRQLNSK